MTLDERLKEIIDRHNYNLCMLPGIPDQEAIISIKQAVLDSLPGEHTENDFGYDSGWNSYRDEVRKGLGFT